MKYKKAPNADFSKELANLIGGLSDETIEIQPLAVQFVVAWHRCENNSLEAIRSKLHQQIEKVAAQQKAITHFLKTQKDQGKKEERTSFKTWYQSFLNRQYLPLQSIIKSAKYYSDMRDPLKKMEQEIVIEGLVIEIGSLAEAACKAPDAPWSNRHIPARLRHVSYHVPHRLSLMNAFNQAGVQAHQLLANGDAEELREPNAELVESFKQQLKL